MSDEPKKRFRIRKMDNKDKAICAFIFAGLVIAAITMVGLFGQ